MEKMRFWFQISLNAIQFLYGGGRELNETQPKIPKVEIFYKEIGENGRNQMIRRNLDERDVSNPTWHEVRGRIGGRRGYMELRMCMTKPKCY